MKESIKEYIQYLVYEKNYSSHTIDAYARDIQEFRTVMKISSWNEVTPTIVSEWFEKLQQNAPRTMTRKLSALKNFYHFLIKKNIVANNPFQSFTAPKSLKHIPTILSQEEISEFLFSLPENSLLDQRNKIMLIFLYMTGIRSEELCSIRTKDIDLYQHTVLIFGKGQKQRIVPLLPFLEQKIQTWLEIRPCFDKENSEYLFLSHNGRQLTTSMIRKIIDKSSTDFGTSKKMHPHAFRYVFATHLLENDTNLRYIQNLLGHANLSVTQRYTQLSIHGLKQKYHQFHPRG